MPTLYISDLIVYSPRKICSGARCPFVPKYSHSSRTVSEGGTRTFNHTIAIEVVAAIKVNQLWPARHDIERVVEFNVAVNKISFVHIL